MWIINTRQMRGSHTKRRIGRKIASHSHQNQKYQGNISVTLLFWLDGAEKLHSLSSGHRPPKQHAKIAWAAGWEYEQKHRTTIEVIAREIAGGTWPVSGSTCTTQLLALADPWAVPHSMQNRSASMYLHWSPATHRVLIQWPLSWAFHAARSVVKCYLSHNEMLLILISIQVWCCLKTVSMKDSL